MPASPADSAIYGGLLGDKEVGRLFTDSAEVRAMMLVEGALAKAQGALGVIPETSAAAIHRASLELQIDPAGLDEETARNAVPVPALVRAFREAMQAPEHAAFLHWGATSQDIMDTSLALRLRQALGILVDRLNKCLGVLADLADEHAELPMVARTYGQAAVVTSFGAVAADWGRSLLRHRKRLPAIRADVEIVSLSGAAGTLSAMGDQGGEVRAALADALLLGDPGESWHSTRDGIAALAGWLTGVTGSLGKMGEDLLILTQTGIDEATLGGGGSSSTMPHKSNPVGPSVLAAIARQTVGLNSVVQTALPHRQQRDAAAWISEWMALPQIVILTAKSLAVASDLKIVPNAEVMSRHIRETNGMIFAEALSFALAETMPRPEAQAVVKAMATRAKSDGMDLREAIASEYPDLEVSHLFDPIQQLGRAPIEARAFAIAAREKN